MVQKLIGGELLANEGLSFWLRIVQKFTLRSKDKLDRLKFKFMSYRERHSVGGRQLDLSI